jgi:hypothetical protein
MTEKHKRPVILDVSDEDEIGQDEEEDPASAKNKRAKKPTLKKSLSGEMFVHVLNLNIDCQLESDKENVESEAKKLAALRKQVATLTRKLKESEESAPLKGNVTYCCHV